MQDRSSRPSDVTHFTMRVPFNGEQALAVDLLIAYLKAEKVDNWASFSANECVEWGKTKGDLSGILHTMCVQHQEVVLQGFYLLLDGGYLCGNDDLLLRGTKLLFDRLGVSPPSTDAV